MISLRIDDKIVTRSDIRTRRFERSASNGTVVLAGGCFDIFHAGHLDYLEQAKALGSCLVVGINSDESVRRVKHQRPLFTAPQRSRIVASLLVVDYVFVFDEADLCLSIEELMPDYFVKGVDYAGRQFPEIDSARRTGCELRFLGASKISSSSLLSRKLFERYSGTA